MIVGLTLVSLAMIINLIITHWANFCFAIMNLTMVIISITKLVILILHILLFYPNKFNHNQ
jgi:hypothetical protein